jgi:hypothetical protein
MAVLAIRSEVDRRMLEVARNESKHA